MMVIYLSVFLRSEGRVSMHIQANLKSHIAQPILKYKTKNRRYQEYNKHFCKFNKGLLFGSSYISKVL